MKQSTEEVLLVLFWSFFIHIPALIFLKAWLVMALWSWFVAPLGVMPLTLGLAMGISVLSSVLTFQVSSSKEDDDLTFRRAVVKTIGYSIMYVLCYFVGLFALLFV